jgi:formylglycine-generating enzyme required for sulfatase activity
MAHHDLFISYHGPDRETVTTVRALLQQRGISSFLDRQQLVAGLPWPQALEQALADVHAVAIFLGPRGLGLWQKREMWFALDRQTQEERAGRVFPVIPVLLPGADPAAGFLFLNTWIDFRRGLQDEEALGALVRAVGGERAERAEKRPSGLIPYRGLQVFREEHAAFFCGREAFNARLLDAVLKRSLVAVIGASGSGKSSVVQAGLIPALRRQRPPAATWDVAVFTPGERPYHRLATALVPLLEPEVSDEVERLAQAEKLGDRLARGEIKLEATVQRLLEKSLGTDRLLLVVDQFEELFTTVQGETRAPFVNRLFEALAHAPLSVVLTLRADFYGNALSLSRALSDALEQALNLRAMDPEELERAIVEPAKRVGLSFEPRLVARILEDVAGEPGHLPLLEFALTELWARRAGEMLTHNAYAAIGGVKGALTRRAEEEFAKLNAVQQETARRVLTRLVRVARPEEGSEDTRRRITLLELDEEAQGVVRRLAAARLLVTGGSALRKGEAADRIDQTRPDNETPSDTVEVAHEALIRGWERLHRWVDEDRAFLLWRQGLRMQAGEWAQRGHEKDALLRGRVLTEAEGYLTQRAEALTDTEKVFIRASRKLRVAQRRRATVAGITAVTVVAYGVWLVWQGLTPKHGWVMLLAALDLAHVGFEPVMVKLPREGQDLQFVMGSEESSDEQPPHPVDIQRPFAIGQYEVTFKEYDRYLFATGRKLEDFPRDQGWGRGTRPVIYVSWQDVKGYAKWLSEETGKHYRLPTEAEWEYAARARTTTPYWWGDDIQQHGKVWANCYNCGSKWDAKQTAPVGSFEPNPFGLYDTLGNVWEWVEDCWHGNYEGAPTDGSAWLEEDGGNCARRVVRGGSWNYRPWNVRSATRDWSSRDGRNFVQGFRLAQDL